MQGWLQNFSFGQFAESQQDHPQKESPALPRTSPKHAERNSDAASDDLDDFSDLPSHFSAAMKRTTTFMRTSLDALEVKLNTRIDNCIKELETKCTIRLDALEISQVGSRTNSRDPPAAITDGGALSARNFGPQQSSLSDEIKFNSLKADVQIVIDAIRLEIANVKQKIGMLNDSGDNATSSPRASPWLSSKASPRGGQELVFKGDVDNIVAQLSNKFERVESDLEAIRNNQEHAYVKACYLALSAPDCSKEEKEKMFNALQEQENRWHSKVARRPNGDDAISDSSSKRSSR
mmetsp:Transcript_92570/g.145292  ORF Transcript_92570/g.145292 Transcript_92570/m.145292 type:complete len:292 (+) Transcript_92570:67-942(+)